MNDTTGNTTSSGPSGKTILKAAALTFIGALIVTVLFVLPAEYGVDPTGVGKITGLTRLAGAGEDTAGAAAADAAPRIVQGTFPEPPAGFDYYDPEVLGDPFSRSHDTPFRSATIEIPLDEFEQVEVKAVMKQGDALVYSWKLAEGETVYSDFHADPSNPEGYPERYWIRYAESENPSASGSLVAPFDGNHGWYWMNIEENPVKVVLEVHGYYESLEEIMRSYQ